MRRIFMALCLITIMAVGILPTTALAHGGGGYTVQPGDTMLQIAGRYGVDVGSLAAANGLAWDAWLYTGQYLNIPGGGSSTAGATTTGSYTVQRGDTLFSIATYFGTTVAALQTANGLTNANFVYTGQQLTIPGQTNTPYVPQTPTVTTYGGGERWIDVNISNQTVTAYEGNTPVYTTLASTGTWQYPTVVGTFNIYVKYDSARMAGGYGADAYDLANVPYVMYFYGGYGLHGTYWHNNFGTPMSHGCVNLSTEDAKWLFEWASIGTEVVTHY